MRGLGRNRFLWLAIPLLFAAASLRLSGVAWDSGIGAHPDERFLVGVAEGLAWPGRASPFAVEPAFSYGHLPVYLIVLVGGQDRLLAARLLAGLSDTATVALAAALGCKIGGRRVGLTCAAFLAVMPGHVQQAHFATVDPFLAFFAIGSLLFAARLAERGRLRDGLLAGLWAGLAIGCKAAGALLAIPIIAACAVEPGSNSRRILRGLVAAGAAVAVFGATNPYVLLELDRFVANVAAQTALARGTALAPYTFQFHGTLPYLYPIVQQAAWGMGMPLALVCFGGLAVAVWRATRQTLAPAKWVCLAWALPFFAFTGGLFAKFPRYLLPLTPLLAVYGANLLVGGRRPSLAGRAVVLLSILPAGLMSAQLVLSYRQPHPWVAASAWMEAHLPEGSVVAVEEWDHPLPVYGEQYDRRVLPVYDEESDVKWASIDATLAGSDVVVIASRRGYAALAGWPEQFPETAAYYRALLAGELGFEVVACFGRWPHLAGLALADDPFRAAVLSQPACSPRLPAMWLPRLDESWVVYDHPLVIILERSATLPDALPNGIIPRCITCRRDLGAG